MDPVTLLITALTAGAAAALQETAGTAIKDAYSGLVGLLRTKLGNNEKAKAVLDDRKKISASGKKTLEKAIVEQGLANDKEVSKQTRKLHKLLEKSGYIQNNIVNINGGAVQGFVNENKGSVVMNFGIPAETPPKKKMG